VKAVQNAVNEFESLNTLTNLPNSEDYAASASLLFMQFLLDRKIFKDIFPILLDQELYLKECYEPSSILLQKQTRDELGGVFGLLEQFEFRYGFYNNENIEKTVQLSADLLVQHPLTTLRDVVKIIVNYFMTNSQAVKGDLTILGDESKREEIGILVRQKLCPAIVSVLTPGFKVGLFSNVHIWHMIEEAAEIKKASAVDVGGIALPSAVFVVNQVIEKAKQSVPYDLRFRVFVCHALNENNLGSFMKTIVSIEPLMDKYFEQDALIRKKEMQERFIKFLLKLDKLPYGLSLVS
jgi:hypothetical protein